LINGWIATDEHQSRPLLGVCWSKNGNSIEPTLPTLNLIIDLIVWGIPVIDRYGWQCHAYCLMDRHDHLRIEKPQPNLSLGMRQ
jgi:hypothetical protein